MGVLYQVLATVILSYLCLATGLLFTWPSSTLINFTSTNTTLNRVITEVEVSLLGSLSSVGALVSTPTAGYFVDKFGRKPCSIVSNIMAVIGWSLIALSNQVEVVLTAIFICGLSSTVFVVNFVYIGEICQDSIRGAMTSAVVLFYGIGMSVSYIMGGMMEYWTMVYADLAIAVLGSIGLIFLKESPLYLLSKGMNVEAAKAIAFYRQVSVSSKEVLDELDSIKRSLNPELENVSNPEEEKKEDQKRSVLQFIKKSRSTRQAFMVTLVLMTMTIFQGLPVIQVYAAPLFKQAIPTVSPTLCSIVLAVVNALGGLVGAFLTDTVGRKPLIIYGSIGSGVSCLLLASQVHLQWGPNWLTVLFINFFYAFFVLGAASVPYVLTSEVFLPEVKSFANMVLLEWAWICNCVILSIFNPLVSVMGLGSVFYVFALMCFLTAVFSLFYLPETKALPVDAIQKLFSPKEKKNTV